MLSKGLRLFATAWGVLVAVTVGIACVGAVFMAANVWAGLRVVQSWFSPYNIWNFLALLIFYSPAFLAWYLADRIDARRRNRAPLDGRATVATDTDSSRPVKPPPQ